MNDAIIPLKKSILKGIALLLISLCIAVCILQYFSIRHTYYRDSRDYIENVLRYTASVIDTDDLAQCIRTGEESPKYKELQRFLNQVRESMDLHFLYIIIPLNTEERDNIQTVIAAVGEDEYENPGDQPVRLNQLTGDSYSSAVAAKYLEAYKSGILSFFEETSRWGRNLTGLLPLFDSHNHPIAALCMDMDITSMNEKILHHLLNTGLIIVTIGLLFASVFITWADRRIIHPLKILETKVRRLVMENQDTRDPDSIVLQVPEIRTQNEVGILARSMEQMSLELRDYMKKLISREKELAKMSISANRDELTRVGNLNAYNQYAENLQLKMTEEKLEFAILMADVDDLKKKNDVYGHEQGNQYLQNCCTVICDVFRHSPVFRIGEDEFVAALTGEDFYNRRELVRMVRDRCRSSWAGEDALPWERLSVSIGIADYEEDRDRSVEDVFNRAAHAMYEARSVQQTSDKDPDPDNPQIIGTI